MKDLTKLKTPFGLLKPKTGKALRRHGGPYQVWDWSDGWRDRVPSWGPAQVIRAKPGFPILPLNKTVAALREEFKPITLTTVVGSTDPHPIFAAVKEWQEARKHWQSGEDCGELWAAANALAEIEVPE